MSLSVPTSLNKTQKRKVSPAAKFVLSNHYQGELKVPKWSDIGTLVQRRLREEVVKRLRETDSGDVAEYLDVRHDELEKYIHQRVRSMREARNCNGAKGRGDKSLKDPTLVAARPFVSSTHCFDSGCRAPKEGSLENRVDSLRSSELSPSPVSHENRLSLPVLGKEQHQVSSLAQQRSQTWGLAQTWNKETRHTDTLCLRPAAYVTQRFDASYSTGEEAKVPVRRPPPTGLAGTSPSTTTMSPLLEVLNPKFHPSHGMHQTPKASEEQEQWSPYPSTPEPSPASTHRRKRKRRSCDKDNSMKAPMASPSLSTHQAPNGDADSENPASCRRFCYICETFRCHHTMKEQAAAGSNAASFFIGTNPGCEASPELGMPVALSTLNQTAFQRRHTTEVSSLTMAPLLRNATEPRRSLQIESRSVGPLLSPFDRTSHYASKTSAVSQSDSGYSTRTASEAQSSPVYSLDSPGDAYSPDESGDRKPRRNLLQEYQAARVPSAQQFAFRTSIPSVQANAGGGAYSSSAMSEDCSAATVDQQGSEILSRECSPASC